MIAVRIFFLSIILVINVTFVYAQSISPDASSAIGRQQGQILQRNKQLKEELERELSTQPSSPPSIEIPPQPEEKAVTGSKVCVTVKIITLEGADHLSDSEKEGIVQPHLGKCLTLDDLGRIVRAVTDLYGAKGYVTSRAFLKPQDISTGAVVISVIEGRISGFEWNGEKADTLARIVTAFPGTQGEILDLRDIEQGLDQINRLRSEDAKMKLLPGDEPGASLIQIEDHPQKWWRTYAGADNSGETSTGLWQGKGGIELDSPLGLNDFWSFTHNQDTQEQSSLRASSAWSGFVSIPWGYWLISLSADYFSYASTVISGTQSFQIGGTSVDQKIQISRVVERDSSGKTNIDLSLTHKIIENTLEGTPLDTSSWKLAVIDVDLGRAQTLLGGSAFLAAGYQNGLHLLGASRNGAQGADMPRPQFRKLTADISYSHPIPVGRMALQASTSAHGQWSVDPLYATEQLGLGSESTIPGFRNQTVIGETGGYWRNELSLPMPVRSLLGDSQSLELLLGTVQPFVGYDWGQITRNTLNPASCGRLSGVAVGFRLTTGVLQSSVTYGQALSQPAALQARGHELYVSTTINY